MSDDTKRPEYGDRDPRTLFFYLVDERSRCCACNVVIVGDGDQSVLPVVGNRIDFYDDTHAQSELSCTACRDAFDRFAHDEQQFLYWLRERIEVVDAPRHRGLDYYRVIVDRTIAERERSDEVIFADRWQYAQTEQFSQSRVIDRLTMLPCRAHDTNARQLDGSRDDRERCALEGGVTDRDAAVAATVAQWLGTNVGFSWLSETLRQCGYTLTRRLPK